MVIPPLDDAVVGDGADFCRKVGVHGKDRSSVAKATQRLGREERGGGNDAEAPQPFAVKLPAKALRRILDQVKPIVLTEPLELGVVGGKSKEIHRNHRLGAKLFLTEEVLQRPLYRYHIDTEILIHLHKDRRSPHRHDGFCRRHKVKAGQQYPISLTDAKRPQRELQRIGAVGAGDRLGPHILAKTALQLADLFAAYVDAALQDPAYSSVDPLLIAFIILPYPCKFQHSYLRLSQAVLPPYFPV